MYVRTIVQAREAVGIVVADDVVLVRLVMGSNEIVAAAADSASMAQMEIVLEGYK